MNKAGKFIMFFVSMVLVISCTSRLCFAQVPAGVAVPDIKSPSCVVMDALSGQVLFQKNADEMRAPASVTKIMTLILALEDVAAGKVSMSDEAVASEHAHSMGGTEVWAPPGESMPLEEWIKAVAVASANDGAVILAEFLDGTEEAFTQRMNRRARELGMMNSEFKNSHGLDEEGHLTTAMDVAIMSRHAVYVPGLLDFTKIYQTEFRGGKNELTNFNKLVYLYSGCDGLKTGMTSKSGYCLSATAQRGDSRFIVVIMGAATPEQRQNEAWTLLDWAFANFRSVEILQEGEVISTVRVVKGKTESVDVFPAEAFAITLSKEQKGEVRWEIVLERPVAPFQKGSVLGHVVIEVDGKKVAVVPLLAGMDVERAGFLDHIMKYFRAFVVGR
jgi:D-alanyl-D-alanine carboxypeptidase (penicillin-binding protein 5/6)